MKRKQHCNYWNMCGVGINKNNYSGMDEWAGCSGQSNQKNWSINLDDANKRTFKILT